MDRGNISKIDLDNALKMQSNRDAMLGEIIISHKLAKTAHVNQALDLQYDGANLDLKNTLPDPDLLQQVDPFFCLQNNVLPWRHLEGQVVIAAKDPFSAQVRAFAYAHWQYKVIIARADPQGLENQIQAAFAVQLTEKALQLCPEQHSCRNIGRKLSGRFGALAVGLVAATACIAPTALFLALFFAAMLANIATTCLRGASLIAYVFGKDDKAAQNKKLRLITSKKRPKVSILLPLFHENRVLDSLLAALEKLTYPKELLDIKILLEEEDTITAAAVAARHLPRWISVITVPKDVLQTKPRAMNFALPFCKGEIIGIYDAEDRPDPDQIDLVVSHFAQAPIDVGSVQCFLDFYNSKSNWIARCFTIEYAVWFRVIMRGLQRIGAPLPLGGTSVFVRKDLLEKVGAWDAHNVTEDADLGMRLARYGYKCEVVASTTWEEANNRPIAWIKQRSRWLKGFAMTWATHMRNPIKLFQELGLIGFFGFQIILLGTVTSFLTAPIFWIIWTGYLGVDWAFFSALPQWIWVAAFWFLLIGETVMISICTVAMLAKNRLTLIPFIFTLFLYWPLGTIAAFKALFELFFAPFYWDKTDHGLS